MTDSTSTSGRRRYWKVLRFGICSSVIVPIILGAIVGLLYARTHSAQYKAQAIVRVNTLVTPLPGGSLQANLPDMPTEQETAGSAAVAIRAKSLLKTATSVKDLQQHLKAGAASTGNILVISYTSTSPTQAARYANAFATAYLSYRNAALNNLIGKEKLDIGLLKSQIPHDGKVLRTADVARLQADESLLKQLEAAGPFSGGTIVSSATPPTTPSSPNTSRDVALGLAAGLVVASCLALQSIAYRYLERHRSAG